VSNVKTLEVTWQIWRSSRLVTTFLVIAWGAMQAMTFLTSSNLATQLAGCADQSTGACGAHAGGTASSYIDLGNTLLVAQMVIPVLIGIFWGAPLVAREYESHTYLYAWTQDVSPLKWTSQRLVLLALVSACMAFVSGLSMSGLADGIHRATSKSMFTDSLFESNIGIQIAYYLLALTVGFTAGVYLRRSVPALGATLFSFVAIRIALTIMRLKWLPTSNQSIPFTSDNGYTKVSLPGENSIQLNVYYTNSVGSEVPFPDLACSQTTSTDEWERCVRSHGVDQLVTTYQPGSHLQIVQILEIAACFLLVVLLAAVGLRRIRKAVAVS
jgi:hypothetical protein